MKKIILCAAAFAAAMGVTPVLAGDPVEIGASPRFHRNAEHLKYGHGLDPIFKRYPRPEFYANEFNIPEGAGTLAPRAAPVRVYALGEASAPVARTRSYDAKGRATRDRRRAAWAR